MQQKRSKLSLVINKLMGGIYTILQLVIKSLLIFILKAIKFPFFIAKHIYYFLRSIEKPSWLMATVVPFLLIFALIFGITIENGFYYLSLETVFAITVSALCAIVIGVMSRKLPLLHYLFIGTIISINIDAYIVRDMNIAMIVYAIAIVISIIMHKYLTNVFYIVLSVIFIFGLVREYPPKDDEYVKITQTNLANANNSALKGLPMADINKKIVIHFVMDEMGALHSMPLNDDRKKDVKYISAEYKKRGFSIFEPYYSISRHTPISLGYLLSLEENKNNVETINNETSNRLIKNDIHDLFVSNNWNVTILHSNYVDICTSKEFNCKVYKVFKYVREYQKHINVFSERFDLWNFEVLHNFTKINREILPFTLLNSVLPDWLMNHVRIVHQGSSTSLGTLKIMEDEKKIIEQEIKSSTQNIMLFKHLMLPHYPYNLDRDCQLKPRKDWDDPENWGQHDYEHMVQAYWDQSVCAHARLLDLIDQVDKKFPNQIQFIIHGDHGSRALREGEIRKTAQYDDPQYSDAVKSALFSPFIAFRVSDPSIIPTNAKTMQELVRPVLISLAKSSRQ
ncbi:MAG: hypothetical protein QM523_06575 [Candidatus Pacebacteria bacterium]|nr:hypothetical protein [Candidatus Paceibacterota bacterium]